MCNSFTTSLNGAHSLSLSDEQAICNSLTTSLNGAHSLSLGDQEATCNSFMTTFNGAHSFSLGDQETTCNSFTTSLNIGHFLSLSGEAHSVRMEFTLFLLVMMEPTLFLLGKVKLAHSLSMIKIANSFTSTSSNGAHSPSLGNARTLHSCPQPEWSSPSFSWLN